MSCGFEHPGHQIEGRVGLRRRTADNPPTGKKLVTLSRFGQFGPAFAGSPAQHKNTAAIVVLCLGTAFGAMAYSTTSAHAQFIPTTPHVTAGGQALFRSVPDAEIVRTLAAGEFLLSVCKSVLLPRMQAQVGFLWEELTMRLGSSATEAVMPTVRKMLADNPNIDVSACVDSPSVGF